MELKSLIRTIPDFPQPGIQFRDITTLLLSPEGFQETIDVFVRHYQHQAIDVVVGIESRGFIFGAALALQLKKPFVLARKPGKLPGETKSVSYDLEYGTDSLHIHADAILPGSHALILDDLIATGGTAKACCRLVEEFGGSVVGCGFVIELPDLDGRKRLADYPVYSIMSFEGD